MSQRSEDEKNKKHGRALLNFRYAPPVFISLILLAGHFTFGILESYQAILIAISSSIITELLLSKLITSSWKNISSAYITGISVSILIRSTVLWPFAVAAVISIMSKYVLRFNGRHIWNPSNFGISWLLFFAPLSVAGLSIQWGNNLLPMLVIWILGLAIVWRAKRLHITLTYVISFILFSFLRSLITGDSFFTEVSPLTGPMYQLFVFFMITDPATTVKNKKGQILVAFLIALVEFFLRLNQMIYAPFYALFLVGPAAMMIHLHIFNIRRT
ncbi:MAG: RnfABCDGE type electron transport complex subunit D [Bacteroidales bacterium]|nr:RnfABCDGE type electron transport complex subunit D [Bacteroidales bacterium]